MIGWLDGWLADTVRYATVFYCITGDCNGCYYNKFDVLVSV